MEPTQVITRFRCNVCKQCPEEMQPVSPGFQGNYTPTEAENKRDPYPVWEQRAHEEFVCACGTRHNWYSLTPSIETWDSTAASPRWQAGNPPPPRPVFVTHRLAYSEDMVCQGCHQAIREAHIDHEGYWHYLCAEAEAIRRGESWM